MAISTFHEILPQGGKTALERVEEISRIAWELCVPPELAQPDDQLLYAYWFYKHPTQDRAILCTKTGQVYFRYTGGNYQKYRNLFPEASNEDLNAIATYVTNNTHIDLANIFPFVYPTLTHEDLVTQGYFIAEIP